jgi:hypothetical protein
MAITQSEWLNQLLINGDRMLFSSTVNVIDQSFVDNSTVLLFHPASQPLGHLLLSAILLIRISTAITSPGCRRQSIWMATK